MSIPTQRRHAAEISEWEVSGLGLIFRMQKFTQNELKKKKKKGGGQAERSHTAGVE